MGTTVFTHAMAQRLRATLLFSLGLVGVSAMYVGIFPSFQDQMAGYADAMPEALSAFMGDDFASPAGYIGSTIFGVLGPVLFVAAAASFGAGAIAGEEEDRTLALLMTTPVSRVRLALEKAAAVVGALTVITLVLLLALLGVSTAAGVDIGGGALLAGAVHLHALAILTAGVAFGVGAALGRKALALGAAAGIVALGYVLHGVGGMLELDWLRWISPFSWYAASEPVRHGVAWGWLALLYATAVLAAAGGIWRFARRDLS